jgi:hypothetical protein
VANGYSQNSFTFVVDGVATMDVGIALSMEK